MGLTVAMFLTAAVATTAQDSDRSCLRAVLCGLGAAGAEAEAEAETEAEEDEAPI